MSTVNTLNLGAETDTTKTAAPEGHDAAMAAAYEASQNQTLTDGKTPEGVAAEPATKPDWLPEKFWKDGKADFENLAKSYGELEKGKAQKPADVPPEAAAVATQEEASEALASVGLDYAAISTRFQQNGELAAEDRAALNKAGVPDAMIDAYVAGQQAIADTFQKSIFDLAGGKDQYGNLTAWAAQNLTPAEITSFNKVMDGNDADAAKLAVQGLKAKHDAVVGSDPQLVVGSTAPPSAGDVFRSNEELRVAMNDPRYKNDPAYRNDVIAKLSRSSIL